ncbi:MAG: hypothetical protein WDN31_10065 [Hyphomicrobium sp.]
MQHRPLMKRLARVGASHGGAAEFVAKSAAQAAPNSAAHAATTSAPAEMPHLTADPRSIEELIDDLGHVAASPPSAAWLENARRAHRQAQVTHAVAWVTTLAIAVSIIGVALLLPARLTLRRWRADRPFAAVRGSSLRREAARAQGAPARAPAITLHDDHRTQSFPPLVSAEKT